jgi:ketosteroid isomerase-like protein
MKTINIYFAMLFFFAFTSNGISQDNAKIIYASFDYNTQITSDYLYGQGYKITKYGIFMDIDSDYLFDIPAKDTDLNFETPSNLSIIDSAYKAFAVGDIPSVLGVMDVNIIWNEAEGNTYADGNPYIGPDAVLNGVFVRIGADHEYFNLTDIVLHEMSNNKVLATLRYQAKLKKNGAEYNTQAAHLWRLKDGKVINFQQYVDTKQLADAFSK